jgi:hypothetical protein
MNKATIKTIGKYTIGIILLILATGLFFADRFILLFMPWMSQTNIKTFLKDSQSVFQALWRVGGVIVLLTLIEGLKLII